MIAFLSMAMAGTCSDGGMPQGPLTVGLHAGDLGRPRTACLRSEVGLGGGAALVVDTADFYGRIQLNGTLDGRVKLPDLPVTIDLGLEPFRQDTVIAPITVSASGLGGSWVGATWQLEDLDTGALAATARVILPTQAGANQRPMGLDIGLMGVRQWTKKTQIHGGMTVYDRFSVGPGPSADRVGLGGLAGIQFQPGKAFALVLDAPVSLGFTGTVDHIALAPGVRVAAGPWSLELGVFAPLVGADRTLAAVDLRTAVRF